MTDAITKAKIGGSRKKLRGLELPSELSGKVWLHESEILTSRVRPWQFCGDGIYQIQQDSDRQLLVFLRDEGIHHVFRSYRAKWLTTFTDAQLVGREVLKMAEDIMPCPHCGGKEIQVELIRDAIGLGVSFVGRVSCRDCGAVTSWRVGVSRDALKQAGVNTNRDKGQPSGKAQARPNSLRAEEEQALMEKLARELLIATWNERTR